MQYLLNSTAEVRDIQKIKIGNTRSYLLGINNDSLKIVDAITIRQNLKD